MVVKKRAVSKGTMPSVEVLKLAIVGAADEKVHEVVEKIKAKGVPATGDKIYRWATFVRASSKTVCFFCEAPSDPLLKKATKLSWPMTPLCQCLYPYRTQYREYYPRWMENISEIAEKVRTQKMSPADTIYSDTCFVETCKRPFKVTARMIARSVVAHGDHKRMRRCEECAAKFKAELRASKPPESRTPATQPMTKAAHADVKTKGNWVHNKDRLRYPQKRRPEVPAKPVKETM